MIHVQGIDHVCLTVTDLARAGDYFQRVFAFECHSHPTAGGMLIVESPCVHFFLREERTAPAEFLSQQHLSFRVPNLDQVVARLAEEPQAVYELGEVAFFKYHNYKWCEWRGPDRIRLECIEVIEEGRDD